MRKIDRIVIHCADTPASMDIGVDEIRKWHTDPEPGGRGWSDIGYHFVVRRDGTVEKGRPVSIAGAHAPPNAHSIGICLVGGKGADGKPDSNFTRMQWAALETLVLSLWRWYGPLVVTGHRDMDSRKACPCFDVAAWWGDSTEN